MQPSLIGAPVRGIEPVSPLVAPTDFLKETLKAVQHIDKIVTLRDTLRRGFQATIVSVSTTPVRIIYSSMYERAYRMFNPSTLLGSASAGQVQAGTLLVPTTFTGNFNTQAADLGVANFLSMHLFVNITALTGGGTLSLFAQALDPVSKVWMDTQGLAVGTGAFSAPGSAVYFLDRNGIATDFAIRGVLTGTSPSVTLSIGYVLKEAIAAGPSGISRTVYIGPTNAVNSTIGMPIQEGQFLNLVFEPNLECWAIAQTTVNLVVFKQ